MTPPPTFLAVPARMDMSWAEPALAAPVVTFSSPEFSTDVPELSSTLPVDDPVNEETVTTPDTEVLLSPLLIPICPPVSAILEPAFKFNEPPTCWMDAPPCMLILPLCPASLEPVVSCIFPPLLALLLPADAMKLPLAPAVESPLRNLNDPDSPPVDTPVLTTAKPESRSSPVASAD